MKKLAHKTEITEWYAKWILESCDTPIDEIQWLLSEINSQRFQNIVDMYYEYKNK